MIITKNFALIIILVVLAGKIQGQTFLNPDLNGTIGESWSLPDNWQKVPASDINCQAIIFNFHDTPNLTDLVNPNLTIGLIGNPYSGSTFVSGLRSGDFHEGIMQTVTGYTPGDVYIVNFQQSVVKQFNNLDQSGSWAVYVDDTLVGITLPTFSDAPFNSTSFIWEPRSVTFTATEITHTIKFLPQDDDLNLNSSTINITGGLRMGIDSINLISCNSLIDIGNDTTLCQGESITLDVTTSNATYLWQDNSINPSFNVTQQGTYWVTATVNDCSTSDTINVNFNPIPTLGNDTTLCQGETLTIDATTSNATYLWQDNSTNPTFNVTQQGTYWITATVNNCSASDTINVNFNPIPTINLGNDTTLCQGETLTLYATTPNSTYLWQDNSTNPTFNVTQQGTYWVQIMDSCGSITDTINVSYNPLLTLDLGNDTTLCQGETLTLDVTTSNATYLWQDNSTNSTFNVTQQGTYWVEVILNNCNTSDTILIDYKDCEPILQIPNVFTPNNDGINDLFVPIISKRIVSMKTIIFNRWGNNIFESNKLLIEWTGEDFSDGAYFWTINYTDNDGNETTLNGQLTLLR